MEYQQKTLIKYTALELLAFAVWNLFPQVKLGGGSVEEETFYYDFYCPQPFTPELFPLIEADMYKLEPFSKREMMRENAAEMLRHLKQPLLAELAEQQANNIITLIESEGKFDLCPDQLENEVRGVYKLLKISCLNGGWRIHGTAFENQSEIKKFLKREEEGKKRELHNVGFWSGNVLLPKGYFIKDSLKRWFIDHHQMLESKTEQLNLLLSYRNLPTSYSTINDQDLTYTFCTKEQVQKELISSLQFITKCANMFGFEVQHCLQAKNQLERQWLRKALEEVSQKEASQGFDEERAPDGSAIVIKYIDSIGRPHKGAHVNLKPASELKVRYQGADDKMYEPVVIARSIFGSLDRFITLLIEHNDGLLPLWLSYEQVRIIPIGKNQLPYATRICESINAAGLRGKLDDKDETVAAKIHTAEKEKIPYIVCVGDQEEKNNSLAVRLSAVAEVHKGVHLESFLALLKEEVRLRKITRMLGEKTD